MAAGDRCQHGMATATDQHTRPASNTRSQTAQSAEVQQGPAANGQDRGTDSHELSLKPLGDALDRTSTDMSTPQVMPSQQPSHVKESSSSTSLSRRASPSPPNPLPQRSQPCLDAHTSTINTQSRLQPAAILVEPPLGSTTEPKSAVNERSRSAKAMSAQQLADRLSANALLVVDVRNVAKFEEWRIRNSINVNMPSLLLKRFRRGNTASFSLDAFVTTELGKDILEHREQTPGYKNDIVIVSDQRESRSSESLELGSVLLTLLEKQDTAGDLYYLDRPLDDALEHEQRLRQYMVDGEQDDERPETDNSSDGNHSLQPLARSKQAQLPASPGRLSLSPPRSPTTPTIITPPRTPNSIASSGGRPRPRLKRIDTSDSLLTAPRSRASSGSSSANTRSPAAAIANLRVDPSCPGSSGGGRSRGSSVQSVCSMQSSSGRSPGKVLDADGLELTMSGFPADPTDIHGGNQLAFDSPSTPNFTEFDVSTIIEGLLFLGPEPTRDEDLDKLDSLGVKVVVNLAVECQDFADEISKRFELYKVPMRDVVDETAVQESFETACRIIDQALAQTKPVYCHCRAGKSRSVSIVLAYLVKQRHFSLKRAYDHVSVRRKGIQPNMGFLGELLLWEQAIRGQKSRGLFGPCTPAVEVVSYN
ncbi:hypothetical protein ACM66B_006927 [Microbotryomycetes sp. NB124-2]